MKEVTLSEDAALIRDAARTWRVRFLCPHLGTWQWSPPFQAATVNSALKKCRAPLAELIAHSARRLHVTAAVALAEHEGLKSRANRILNNSSEGWR
jgi:hypothetical protein